MREARTLHDDDIAAAVSAAAPGPARARVVREQAALYNVSQQAIYKSLARSGIDSGRRTRADRGTRRHPVSDAVIEQIARTIHATHTEKNRTPMPAWLAIKLFEDRGILKPGELSEDYLNAELRRRSIAKADAVRRTPHAALQSLHPNHVFQVDASVCAQWYLREDNAVAHQRRDLEVYKNKPGKPRTIKRFVGVDHYTGAIFVQYYSSETARDFVEFFYQLCAPKSFTARRLALDTTHTDSVFPFRGIPRILYADKGSSLDAHAARRVLDNLQVQLITHTPGNPRAKGANETMQRHWEYSFESLLKLRPATSLDELNHWALEFSAYLNSQRPHSRHGQTRLNLWHSEIGNHLLEVPEYDIYKSLAISSPKTRRVGTDGTISFTPPANLKTLIPDASCIYRVPDTTLWGNTVEVDYSLYDFPDIIVTSRRGGEERRFSLSPLHLNPRSGFEREAAVIGESYRAPAYTDSQRAFAALQSSATPVFAGAQPAPVPAPAATPERASIDARTALTSCSAAGSFAPPEIPIPADAPDPAPAPANVFPLHADYQAYPPVTGETLSLTPQQDLVSPLVARERILNMLHCDFCDLSPYQRDIINSIEEAIPTNELDSIVTMLRDDNPSTLTQIPGGLQ
jgi:hypothetical protein